MSGSIRFFWMVVAAVLGLYLVMVVWSLPKIAAMAGGLPAFDLRPGGYSHDEARAFLAALPAEGVHFYRTVQHRLDTAFPALLAVMLGWSILRLAPARWHAWRWLLAAIALPGMMFDYGENAGVAAMLAAGPQAITPAGVASVSLLSRLKAAWTTAAFAVLVILLLLRAIQRWRALHKRS